VAGCALPRPGRGSGTWGGSPAGLPALQLSLRDSPQPACVTWPLRHSSRAENLWKADPDSRHGPPVGVSLPLWLLLPLPLWLLLPLPP
jgi:hypothetical protein